MLMRACHATPTIRHAAATCHDSCCCHAIACCCLRCRYDAALRFRLITLFLRRRQRYDYYAMHAAAFAYYSSYLLPLMLILLTLIVATARLTAHVTPIFTR